MRQHHIIYIPGLNDQHLINRNLTKLIPFSWKLYGVQGYLLAPHWEDQNPFSEKLQTITDKIDELVQKGYIVSLIGQSAGGSAAMNAFCKRRKVVNGVINIAGRLKDGIDETQTLSQAAKNSPAFKDSVILFSLKNEASLRQQDRKRIMTIRPIWDEIVPASTVAVSGALNITVPIIEHTIGGVFISTFLAKQLINFLKNLES